MKNSGVSFKVFLSHSLQVTKSSLTVLSETHFSWGGDEGLSPVVYWRLKLPSESENCREVGLNPYLSYDPTVKSSLHMSLSRIQPHQLCWCDSARSGLL